MAINKAGQTRISRGYLFRACCIVRESVTIIWVYLAETPKDFFFFFLGFFNIRKKYGFRSAPMVDCWHGEARDAGYSM